MDEEDDDQPAPQDNPLMRSFALTATAEFLLFVGVLFIMLGVSAFLTDRLGIKGSGEGIVGTALVIVAFVLLLRMRPAVPIRVVQRPPPIAEKPKDNGDYR